MLKKSVRITRKSSAILGTNTLHLNMTLFFTLFISSPKVIFLFIHLLVLHIKKVTKKTNKNTLKATPLYIRPSRDEIETEKIKRIKKRRNKYIRKIVKKMLKITFKCK